MNSCQRLTSRPLALTDYFNRQQVQFVSAS
jgi:hypothetical protein